MASMRLRKNHGWKVLTLQIRLQQQWHGRDRPMRMSAHTVCCYHLPAAEQSAHRIRGVIANDTDAVFPEGPHAIVGQELGGEYFEKAAPIIELQVARAGLRMAVWLDHIVDGFKARLQDSAMSEEL